MPPLRLPSGAGAKRGTAGPGSVGSRLGRRAGPPRARNRSAERPLSRDGPALLLCGDVVTDPRDLARNWSQVRARIDRGETGDKRAVEDPAAAPLGTDAEAGGASSLSEAVARSAAAETAGPAARAAAQGRTPRRSTRAILMLGALAVGAVALILALALALVP